MSKYLCIRCWRIVPLEDAGYACPKCTSDSDLPAWARPDDEVPRPRYGDSAKRWRFQLTVGGSGEPRCPIHRDTSVALYCECGARLFSRARVDADEPLGLGFAGPSTSGKTLLILSAVDLMQAPGLGDRTLTLFGIDDTDQRFASLAQALRDGQRPDRTFKEGEAPAGAISRNFCWELLEANGSDASRRMGLLAVYDLAGEDWNADVNEEFDPRRQPRRLEIFLRYLERLKSLVFLVDGAAVARDLGVKTRDAWEKPTDKKVAAGSESSLLALIHSRLGDQARHIDCALTLSKTDLLWDEPGFLDLQPTRYETLPAARRRELLQTILAKAGRAALLPAARRCFNRVELFAVSSIGFQPTAERVVADCLKEPPRPVGVTAPLQWLLSQDSEIAS